MAVTETAVIEAIPPRTPGRKGEIMRRITRSFAAAAAALATTAAIILLSSGTASAVTCPTDQGENVACLYHSPNFGNDFHVYRSSDGYLHTSGVWSVRNRSSYWFCIEDYDVGLAQLAVPPGQDVANLETYSKGWYIYTDRVILYFHSGSGC